MNNRYCYPLCIQLPPMEDVNSDEAKALFRLLQEKGFYGVELNLLDFERTTPTELQNLLKAYDLRLTMIATGGYAKKKGLSLSSPDEAIRQKTVAEVQTMLRYAHALDAGIICGFIKGDANGDYSLHRTQMIRSLTELKELDTLTLAPLYLEATNHYEALLINTLEEGAQLAADISDRICILPDTYHMNIEEKDMLAAMVRYRNCYKNIHISDNNRYYPGFGAIAFERVLRMLQAMDYQGTISIEGRNLGSMAEDIEKSCYYLERVAKLI